MEKEGAREIREEDGLGRTDMLGIFGKSEKMEITKRESRARWDWASFWVSFFFRVQLKNQQGLIKLEKLARKEEIYTQEGTPHNPSQPTSLPNRPPPTTNTPPPSPSPTHQKSASH